MRRRSDTLHNDPTEEVPAGRADRHDSAVACRQTRHSTLRFRDRNVELGSLFSTAGPFLTPTVCSRMSVFPLSPNPEFGKKLGLNIRAVFWCYASVPVLV